MHGVHLGGLLDRSEKRAPKPPIGRFEPAPRLVMHSTLGAILGHRAMDMENGGHPGAPCCPSPSALTVISSRSCRPRERTRPIRTDRDTRRALPSIEDLTCQGCCSSTSSGRRSERCRVASTPPWGPIHVLGSLCVARFGFGRLASSTSARSRVVRPRGHVTRRRSRLPEVRVEMETKRERSGTDRIVGSG